MNKQDEYAEAGLQRELAEQEAIAEQGIEIVRRDGIVVVQGEVESAARRDEILRHASESFPGKEVRSEIALIPVCRPTDVEDVT